MPPANKRPNRHAATRTVKPADKQASRQQPGTEEQSTSSLVISHVDNESRRDGSQTPDRGPRRPMRPGSRRSPPRVLKAHKKGNTLARLITRGACNATADALRPAPSVWPFYSGQLSDAGLFLLGAPRRSPSPGMSHTARRVLRGDMSGDSTALVFPQLTQPAQPSL